MADFNDVIGQEQIVTHLQNAILSGKVAHAYVIHGERGSGKEFISKIFAKALQCESDEEKPRGVCRSCKQAAGNNHPDIILVQHEKPNTIGVEDMRQKINGDIAIKP